MHHTFWNTQPVPQLSDEPVEEIGPLQAAKEEVRKEPYPLPAAFSWVTLDISDMAQLLEMESLLSENYVEDDGGNFRFDYSADFIRWALQPPNSPKDWIVGVRANASGKLVACITGIAATMKLGSEKHVVKTAEINFLCVHKKLRCKRLVPLLREETTRRLVLKCSNLNFM
jgi:glycylpeptide N-tetradecanoyltransferase